MRDIDWDAVDKRIDAITPEQARKMHAELSAALERIDRACRDWEREQARRLAAIWHEPIY